MTSTQFPTTLKDPFADLCDAIKMADLPALSGFIADLNKRLQGSVQWPLFELCFAAQRAAVHAQEAIARADSSQAALLRTFSALAPEERLIAKFDLLLDALTGLNGTNLEAAIWGVGKSKPDQSPVDYSMTLGLVKALKAQQMKQLRREYDPAWYI